MMAHSPCGFSTRRICCFIFFFSFFFVFSFVYFHPQGKNSPGVSKKETEHSRHAVCLHQSRLFFLLLLPYIYIFYYYYTYIPPPTSCSSSYTDYMFLFCNAPSRFTFFDLNFSTYLPLVNCHSQFFKVSMDDVVCVSCWNFIQLLIEKAKLNEWEMLNNTDTPVLRLHLFFLSFG